MEAPGGDSREKGNGCCGNYGRGRRRGHLICLEKVRLEDIDQRGKDVNDAGDDVSKDLVQFEGLDNPVAVGVKYSKQGFDDALEPIANREVLVRGVSKLDERVHNGHDLIFGYESAAISIWQRN